MATTNPADIIVPEILAESVAGQLPGMKALYGTGAVVVNPTLRYAKDDVGTDVKVPYFGTIGEAQDVPPGGALQIQKLTETAEVAPVLHAGIAVGVSQWARIAAADDPYAEAERQCMVSILRKFDEKLIGAGSASLPAMTVDRYATGENFGYDPAVAGMLAFGDEQSEEDFALWAIGSKALGDLYFSKDSTGKPILAEALQGGLRSFMGKPLAVSDRLTRDTTQSPNQYTSMLAKKNAFALWVNPDIRIEIGRDQLADDWILTIHVYYVVHRYVRLPMRSKGGVALIKHK